MAAAAGETPPCCPEGSLPELLNVDYKPKGERFELTSTCKVYVTGVPVENSSWNIGPVLIMWCDAFGPQSGMHRKLADGIAEKTKGVILLPDPFGDGGLCPKHQDEKDKPQQLGFNRFTLDVVSSFVFGFYPFITRYPWDTKQRPLITDHLIPYLKTKGIEQFAMMGFCFGSWMTMRCCADETIAQHVTCGIHFHPSVKLMESSGNDITLCKQCLKPQLLHATKEEPAAWKPHGAAHTALKDNENVSEVQFTLAPTSQSHGFMTRVDVFNDEVGRAAVQAGLDMALAFLEKYNNVQIKGDM